MRDLCGCDGEGRKNNDEDRHNENIRILDKGGGLINYNDKKMFILKVRVQNILHIIIKKFIVFNI